MNYDSNMAVTSMTTGRVLCLCAGLLCIARASAIGGEARAGETNGAIHINSVGFLPASRKLATIAGSSKEFHVENAKTQEVVFRGQATAPPNKSINKGKSNNKGLWIADFSKVRSSGDYRLIVPGNGTSSRFSISKGVYNAPFNTVMKAMYLWRCGTAVSAKHAGHHFHHKACHHEDGFLDHVGSSKGKKKNAVGGWHDAGDYNKYTVNGAFTVGMMLHAWLQNKDRLELLDLGLPNSDASMPDFLEEVKWEVDWLLKMQADDGRVYHKLSTEKFTGYILPEQSEKPRFFCPWGTAATADFVAVMAMSSRSMRPYDAVYADQCLEAARRSYAFLEKHPEDHRPDQSAFNTGRYDSPDADDRIWAAAELWETTGEEKYLVDFENRIKAAHHAESLNTAMVATIWDWPSLQNLGVFTYLLSTKSRRDPDLLRQAKEDLLASADSIVGTSRRHPYGRPLGTRYYWGCNGTVARQTMNLQIAYELTESPKYRATALNALNYLFGRNPYGRSFVTGVGAYPPLFPHDRRSGADDVEAPWPGYLIGGPWPKATSWVDDQEDYKTNEVAINWNGALIYALSGFVEPAAFENDIKSAR